MSAELQSSGALWKSRWTSWAPVPNKPTVFVDVKQHFNNDNNFAKKISYRSTSPLVVISQSAFVTGQQVHMVNVMRFAKHSRYWPTGPRVYCGISKSTLFSDQQSVHVYITKSTSISYQVKKVGKHATEHIRYWTGKSTCILYSKLVNEQGSRHAFCTVN